MRKKRNMNCVGMSRTFEFKYNIIKYKIQLYMITESKLRQPIIFH